MRSGESHADLTFSNTPHSPLENDVLAYPKADEASGEAGRVGRTFAARGAENSGGCPAKGTSERRQMTLRRAARAARGARAGRGS